MSIDDPKTLVSTEWLANHLTDSKLCILDGSWHMPDTNRNASDEFESQHIPGARFFDIDRVCNHFSDLPHMAPPVEQFMSDVKDLGIGSDHQVVVYDSVGLFSAARVWWLFRYMGHFDIAVLNGGLPAWLTEERPISDEPTIIVNSHLKVAVNTEMIRDYDQVRTASKGGEELIIDARSNTRFLGQVPEPRDWLPSGHIPTSVNVPYQSLLNADGTMKPTSELIEIFNSVGLKSDQAVITSCGSGVTAAVVNLALEIIGHANHALYDGSWTEWGKHLQLQNAST